jgi:hypothetical protein
MPSTAGMKALSQTILDARRGRPVFSIYELSFLLLMASSTRSWRTFIELLLLLLLLRATATPTCCAHSVASCSPPA